jgi:HAD superfamily hydrolase (TIGR01450 family)
MKFSPALRRYDAVLLDLDGCLWVGDEPTPRAPEALAALRAAGLGIVFLTNDARPSVEALVQKLWRLGFTAAASEVVSVGAAVQHLLATERDGGSAYVVGSQALVDHVADAGMKVANGSPGAGRADVVVVAGHDDLRYHELRDATRSVLHGAELIATARDRTFPTADGPAPGSGAVLAAIEYAAGRPADRIAGKPQPEMYRTALDRLGGPERVLAVGDRADTDVAGARAFGLDAALVLSGGAAAGDGAEATHVAPTLAELVLGTV